MLILKLFRTLPRTLVFVICGSTLEKTPAGPGFLIFKFQKVSKITSSNFEYRVFLYKLNVYKLYKDLDHIYTRVGWNITEPIYIYIYRNKNV